MKSVYLGLFACLHILQVTGLSESRGVAAALLGTCAWSLRQGHGVAALTDINHSTCREEFNSSHTVGSASSRGPFLGYWLILGVWQTAKVIITPVLKELQPGVLAAENNTPPVQLKLCSARQRRDTQEAAEQKPG